MNKRSRGAQPGNLNALKHGLYARHYPDEVRDVFVRWDLSDFAAEVQALRVSIDKLVQSILAPNTDPEAVAKKVFAMSAAVSALLKASRQHILFNSTDSPPLMAWLDTLYEHDFFQDGETPE